MQQTHLAINNSGQGGVVPNMAVAEFMVAMFHPSTEEEQAHYRILVGNHKTPDQCRSALMWAYDNVHKIMDIYL